MFLGQIINILRLSKIISFLRFYTTKPSEDEIRDRIKFVCFQKDKEPPEDIGTMNMEELKKYHKAIAKNIVMGWVIGR